MADKFTKEQRSHIMRQVKSRNNKSTELRLLQYFKVNSIKGWRRNFKLHGKPDFVFPKFKTAVFVDGCFWHGHDCRKRQPKSNEDYWQAKILRNQERDAEVTKTLRDKGWRVIRIWECELKDQSMINSKVTNLNAHPGT